MMSRGRPEKLLPPALVERSSLVAAELVRWGIGMPRRLLLR